jgi:hypothetical protein
VIRWPELTPEEQERWLAYAEIKVDRRVTWDEIDQARREYWLKIVRAELQRNRWEDKSTEERRLAVAEGDRQDQEDVQKREDALQFICRDLRVPYTPGEVEVAFWALARRTYGLTGAPKPGNQKYPLMRRLRFAVAFLSAMKKCSHVADVSEREKKALSMLHETKRWGHRQPKGRPTKRTWRSMLDLLSEARAHPPIRDMLAGKTTPWECRQILTVYEIMLQQRGTQM